MLTLRNSTLVVLTLLSSFSYQTMTLEKKLPPNPVRVEFPIGDIEIRHVESDRGMILNVESGPIFIEARRLYFGDGKLAVKYEASQFGMKTPEGIVNLGALKIKNGETIETKEPELEKWGRRLNEVYILVPNLKFKIENELGTE